MDEQQQVSILAVAIGSTAEDFVVPHEASRRIGEEAAEAEEEVSATITPIGALSQAETDPTVIEAAVQGRASEVATAQVEAIQSVRHKTRNRQRSRPRLRDGGRSSGMIGSINPVLYAAEMLCTQDALSAAPSEELISRHEYAELIGISVEDLKLGVEIFLRNELRDNYRKLYGRRPRVSCHGIFRTRQRLVGLSLLTAPSPWKFIELPRVEPLATHLEFERLLVEGSLDATQPNLLEQDNKILRKNALFELVFDEQREGAGSLLDARLSCLAELKRREHDAVRVIKACNAYYEAVAAATFATYPAKSC